MLLITILQSGNNFPQVVACIVSFREGGGAFVTLTKPLPLLHFNILHSCPPKGLLN